MLNRTAIEHQESLSKGSYSSRELSEECLKQAEKYKSLGAFLRIDESEILRQAEESDTRRKEGKLLGPLDGIPVSIKDNIAQNDCLLTCASKILENYRSPYDSFVIQNLKKAGVVLFGRTNMDEFAMGSSTEHSAFQKTCNPWDPKRVPGGSSGGAGVSVASCITPLGLGSDTGGSVRQPAAFCGVFGFRPTYGRVSRYGLVSFASSMDQIGTLSRSAEDCSLLMSVLNQTDPNDSTSHPLANEMPISSDVSAFNPQDIKKLKIGLLLPDKGMEPAVKKSIQETAKAWEDSGAKMIPLKASLGEYAIPIYYIIANAEAASNLSRYDGIRYGSRSKDSDEIQSLYIRTRTENFGAEVRRRILLGTFVLSSGYYDTYYKKAQIARAKMKEEYLHFFEQVDFILSPSSPSSAFCFGERHDPLSMYQSDLLTIPPSLAGLPCMSIPVGKDEKGLPIGVQLTAPSFEDVRLIRASATLAKMNETFVPDFTVFTK